MSEMELKLMTKLAAIDKAMYEVLTDEQRQEITIRVGWLMLQCEDIDPAEGTIWENNN